MFSFRCFFIKIKDKRKIETLNLHFKKNTDDEIVDNHHIFW